MSEPRPLSVMQQTMWFEHRLAPDSPAYNLVLPLRIRTPLDVDVLREAVDTLGRRHEMLRSTFREIAGEPRRFVAAEPVAHLEVQDVPDIDDTELSKRVQEWVDRPFDLSVAAFRVVLLRHTPTDAVLVPVAHHIVSDFVSHWLLVRDLLDAYHDPSRLPELAGSYDDYVAAEAQLVASPMAERYRAFWVDRVADAPVAELPPDRPRPARPGYRGHNHKVRVPADVADRVPEVAEHLGVTPFALLLGAFAAVVHRYTGQADFLLGCPATNRVGRETRDVVGSFVNTFPVRSRLTPATTFQDAAAAANDQLRQGMFYVRYPCGLVQRGNSPLYRIAILMVAADQREPSLPYPTAGEVAGPVVEYAGLRLGLVDVSQQAGQLDLMVRLERSTAGLDVVLSYDSDLFDPATIDRFAQHYLRFVRAAVEHAGTAVADTPLTDDAELARLLAMGSGTSWT